MKAIAIAKSHIRSQQKPRPCGSPTRAPDRASVRRSKPNASKDWGITFGKHSSRLLKNPSATLCERRTSHSRANTAVADRRYSPKQVFQRPARFLLALLLAVTLPSFAPAATRPKPNILFIMTDDHAAHAMSCYGSVVNQTPNMDRIAREGMRFDRCFVVNSICTPSRASILTGKYSHLNGTPVFNRFDGSQPTVAKYLQAAGYHTGMIGKWHLGSDPTGFDQWSVLPGQGLYHDPAFLTPTGRVVIKGYASDIITDQSIDFLKNRPKDKPFFLMSHHKAPHRPWEPAEKY